MISRRICGEINVITSCASLSIDPKRKVGPNALQIAGRIEAFFSLFGRVIFTEDEALVYEALPDSISALEKYEKKLIKI